MFIHYYTCPSGCVHTHVPEGARDVSQWVRAETRPRGCASTTIRVPVGACRARPRGCAYPLPVLLRPTTTTDADADGGDDAYDYDADADDDDDADDADDDGADDNGDDDDNDDDDDL